MVLNFAQVLVIKLQVRDLGVHVAELVHTSCGKLRNPAEAGLLQVWRWLPLHEKVLQLDEHLLHFSVQVTKLVH